jgi:AraC family transcriptional regulator
MINPSPGTVEIAALPLAVSHRPDLPLGIIRDELAWRVCPATSGPTPAEERVVATRWRSLDQRTREVSAETPADAHLVAIVLRNENVRFSLAGRIVHDGSVLPGTVQVSQPAVSARCVFRGPYDVLHLHVPNALITDFSREVSGCEIGELRSEAALTQDPIIERLGRALLAAEDTTGSFGRLYADCISTAIVARLLASTRRAPACGRPKVAELARWRLRRVTEFVDANLAEPVGLADLASAAGLTRMHFAAQFRAATGLPPHEYLLRRRIERAQEMLVQDTESLVEIALSVGFQTQSHFTSVFKRFVGQPPHAWRQCQGGKERGCRHQLGWDTRGRETEIAA